MTNISKDERISIAVQRMCDLAYTAGVLEGAFKRLLSLLEDWSEKNGDDPFIREYIQYGHEAIRLSHEKDEKTTT